MIRTSFAALALVALTLAGCNSSSPDNNGGTTDHTANTGGTPSGGKLKVVFIPKSSGIPYFDEIDKGFKDAAAQFNLDYTETAPSGTDATSQIPIITDQIQRGVDVIAITPNSPDALNQVLDQAKAKGITVITVDADLVGNESHRDAAVLPVNMDEVGPSQLDLMGKLTGYQGPFAILSATADSPNQNAWIAGIKDALKQPKYAKMSLIDTVYGNDEPQKSSTECEGLLAKHADLAGILAPTSAGIVACAQVLERSGNYPGGPHMTGKGIQLTGLSTPKQLSKFVTSGVVTSFQLWNPSDEGFLAGYLGQQIHDKKIVPKAGTELDVPKLGKRGFTAKLELAAGKLQTWDKSNIGSATF